MRRLHVMLRVADLDDSIRFYSALFDADPTMKKTDYAKWMLDDPRINFSIAEETRADSDLGVEHLGIQADTPEDLEVLRHRIPFAEGEVHDEGQTVCCYHQSDKTWVTDGQGVSWEIFHTSGEAAGRNSLAPDAAVETSSAAGAPVARCC